MAAHALTLSGWTASIKDDFMVFAWWPSAGAFRRTASQDDDEQLMLPCFSSPDCPTRASRQWACRRKGSHWVLSSRARGLAADDHDTCWLGKTSPSLLVGGCPAEARQTLPDYQTRDEICSAVCQCPHPDRFLQPGRPVKGIGSETRQKSGS